MFSAASKSADARDRSGEPADGTDDRTVPGSSPGPEAGDEVCFRPPRTERLMPWLAALSSASLPYRVADEEGGSPVIVVPAETAADATEELSGYEAVNRDWPPVSDEEVSVLPSVDSASAVLWCFASLALLRFHAWASPPEWRDLLLRTGALDAEAFRAGDWWRAITSLTLHADATHVLANAIWIGLLGLWTSVRVGPGVAGVLVLLSGVGGNALAACRESGAYRAIGASTSAFGALGLLCGFRFLENCRRWGWVRSIWSRTWLPVAAGAGLLAFMGTGPRADLAGHAAGFGCGFLFALVSQPLSRRRLTMVWQVLLFLGCGFLLVGSWRVALSR